MATGPLFKGPSIHELLKNRGIVTYFQPILSARQRSIVGLEALSRGVGEDSGVIPPRTLFNAADEAGLVDDLDQLCRQQAVRAFARLREEAGDHMLFLNLHVPVAQTPAALASEIDELVTMGGLGPRSLAIEILEAEIQDMGQVRALVNLLRSRGFLIVLDDVGSGHSNLDRIPFIKPDLLKVDRTLISRIDTDYHKRGTLKSLVDLGRKIGALVVAEGVETEGEAMVAPRVGRRPAAGILSWPAERSRLHAPRGPVGRAWPARGARNRVSGLHGRQDQRAPAAASAPQRRAEPDSLRPDGR